ncbi:MAG: cytochrome C [Campylobacterota bacterium]|nr:cytochrome C [Campylobacterota bacterium]
MKKLIATMALTTSFLMAGSYTQADRIKDMQILAEAMQEIQNGFFYNNYDIIKEGTIKLSETMDRVKPPLEEVEEKDVMTRYLNNKVQMTNKVKKKINKKAKDILERFADGDPTQAIQAYTKITKECMKCHIQLRKW